MKRILVCALAAMILMASCLTAFATSYNTTTSYVTEYGGEWLQVSTHVTDADEGEMLTYLAYNDANDDATIADTEVVFIDQTTVPATGEANFVYLTGKGNLTGVDLKFGTNKAGANVVDSTVPSRAYAVEYKGATYNVVVPTAAVETVIVTDLTLVVGEELVSATYDSTDVTGAVAIADGKITIQDSASFNGGTIVVTSEATIEPIDPPTINNGKTLSAVFAKDVEGKLEETLTVFGYAVSDLATGWGGIVVSKDADAIAAYKAGDETADVDVYEALYKGAEGDFAVQLVNKTGTEDLTAGPVYACIYVTNSQHTAYGDTLTLTVAE